MKALFGIVCNGKRYENHDLAKIRVDCQFNTIEYSLTTGENFKYNFGSDDVKFIVRDLKTKEEYLTNLLDIYNFTKAQLFGKDFNRKSSFGTFIPSIVLVDDIMFRWYKYLDFRSIQFMRGKFVYEPVLEFYRIFTNMKLIKDVELSSDYLYFKCANFILKCKRRKGIEDADLLLFLTKLRMINTMHYVVVVFTGLT